MIKIQLWVKMCFIYCNFHVHLKGEGIGLDLFVHRVALQFNQSLTETSLSVLHMLCCFCVELNGFGQQMVMSDRMKG